mmetsp:Transcript_105516/g.227432  ORF Transcript_105516/g.227432 Transcript_105516/m.227432 type:complete len:113 (+) Transcript_105516:1573-1911(+)
MKDLDRLRKVNTEFQNELAIQLQNKETLELMMAESQKQFESKLKTMNFLLQQERNTCDVYKKALEEEKTNVRNILSSKIKTDSERRNVEVECSKLKIECESVKEHFDWMQKK